MNCKAKSVLRAFYNITMDILRKELNQIYQSQLLGQEILDPTNIVLWKEKIASLATTGDEMDVITDASADRCHIFSGKIAYILGISDLPHYIATYESSDEDAIYSRIHPEDLVDKRMLEYEFFKFINPLTDAEKLHHKAACRIRMQNRYGEYIYFDNSTQIIHPSPAGKIWLILCRYCISPNQEEMTGISPVLINSDSGAVTPLSITTRRNQVLSRREKEVMRLIKDGKASKQIAGLLGISIHTVNRHRQNIIEKLSVSNSTEAVAAATAMKLL